MNTLRRLTMLLALLVLAPVASRAARTWSRTEMIVLEGATAPELATRLRAFAESTATSPVARLAAGESWAALGALHSRAGERDSAIACWRRAVDARGALEERLALVDALIARQGPGDADEAIGQLATERVALFAAEPRRAWPVQMRAAWAHEQSGRADSALALVLLVESAVPPSPIWSPRVAHVLARAGRLDAAARHLLPLGRLSHGQDLVSIEKTRKVLDALGKANVLAPAVGRAIADHDSAEARATRAIGGRRVRVVADDGVRLGGLAVTQRVRRPAAIVIGAPGDTIGACDSLAAQFSRRGLQVLVLEPRGTGGSAYPDCPYPEAWLEREHAMILRVARDVRSAVRALARLAPTDTSRVLVVGIGGSARAAAEAARLDHRVKALALVSPMPAPVDRGLLLGALRAATAPTFVQTAAEEVYAVEFANQIAERLPSKRVRVSDGTGPGHRATLYRRDVKAADRLRAWLDEVWAVPSRR